MTPLEINANQMQPKKIFVSHPTKYSASVHGFA
jgi:hypothetical protein